MRLRLTRAALFAAGLLLFAVVCFGETIRHDLAPGVVFQQEIVPPPEGPLVWNVLKIDPKAPGVRVQAALGRDVMLNDEPAKGRESAGDLALRRGALAAVNADFFPDTGRPLGLTMIDGDLVAEGLPYRAVMGVAADGQVRFDRMLVLGSLRGPDGTIESVAGVNRQPDKGDITLLTSDYGVRERAARTSTVAELGLLAPSLRVGTTLDAVVTAIGPGDPNAAMPKGGAVLVGDASGGERLRGRLKVGDHVSVRMDLASIPDASAQHRGELASRAASLRGKVARSDWMDVMQAVGGGPFLVRDGKAAIDGPEEGFSDKGFIQARHPRTAAGVTASGEILLVTVDGRQAFSMGASLPELARYLVGLGAVQAINLDGGGSTTMVVRGLYVNGPSDGAPRPVADALLVFGSAPASPDRRDSPALSIEAGSRAVVDAGGGTALFGTLEGRAFVDQRGFLAATRASSGTVVAIANGAEVHTTYGVRPGPPARIAARFEKAPNDPPDRSVLVVAVRDRFGNGIPGQVARVAATGGTPDRDSVVTDQDGRAEAEIVWERDLGRSAIVRCGALPPARVWPGAPAASQP